MCDSMCAWICVRLIVLAFKIYVCIQAVRFGSSRQVQPTAAEWCYSIWLFVPCQGGFAFSIIFALRMSMAWWGGRGRDGGREKEGREREYWEQCAWQAGQAGKIGRPFCYIANAQVHLISQRRLLSFLKLTAGASQTSTKQGLCLFRWWTFTLDNMIAAKQFEVGEYQSISAMFLVRHAGKPMCLRDACGGLSHFRWLQPPCDIFLSRARWRRHVL